MPQRDHAVIVEPQRWTRPTLELARLLVPMTGAEVGALARVLERGPMTVEGDLSRSDAEALATRLEMLGVPARVTQATDAASTAPAAEPAAPRRLELPRPAETPDETPDQRPTSGDTAEGGWGVLFPDLASSSDPGGPRVPSLDALAGEEDEDDQEHLPPALVPDRLRGTLSGMPVAPVDLGEDAAEPTPPLARDVRSSAAGSPPARPASEPRPSASFDGGSLISELVNPRDERPPYEPAGFDPRPEHLTGVAAFLSAVAPGAGQVFNGDEERALDYGLKFFLIKPWIDSVRDARARAEKIRTHWAPRPDEGTFWRALRYVGAWWLSVILCITLIVWGVRIADDISNRTPEATIGPEQWARAVEQGQTHALAARVAALDAVQAAALEIERNPPFTMSEEERARRLFVIGYAECRSRDLVMCEQMMKRVANLVPGHARALKLQAWSSVAQRGRRDAPMPDVGEVPSLSDIEMRELRQELTLQGEVVPPEAPPAPPEAPPAPPDHREAPTP